MSMTVTPTETVSLHASGSNLGETTGSLPQPSGNMTNHNRQHSAHWLTDQTNLLPFRKIVACFLGLSLCIVVSTLDSVIVATAIPTISAVFKAGSIVSWVPSAYLLTSTSFQPLYGRFSDIFGRKAAISVAMLVFMLGNLLAGFSRTIIQLIVFRGIAGAGGGGIISLSQIIISDIVSLRDRGKYQGIIGGVIALGYAVGPLIGGSLAQKVSWRVSYQLFLSFTPTDSVDSGASGYVFQYLHVRLQSKLLAVDFLGAALTLVGCTLIILPLIWGGVTFPWASAVVLAPLFSGCFIVVLFCIWEWKGACLPIVPMYIFRHATVTGVYITMFVKYVNNFDIRRPGFGFYFQVVLGYDPIGAGVFLIPVLVSQMVLSWISGVIVSRTGRYRNIIHSGFAIWSIACGLISTLKPHSHKVEIVIYMLLAGSGAGQTLQTTTVAAQASVSRRDMSVVTAFRNASNHSTKYAFIRLLGGTLALALGSTILNNSLRTAMNTLAYSSVLITSIVDDPGQLFSPSTLGISSSDATYILNAGYTKGFRTVFILNAILTALATIASVVLIKHKELNRGDEGQLRAASSETKEKVEISSKVTPNEETAAVQKLA
ncbi:hypothetical protein CVT25_006128 [Psilocybe cyanescens]|uniref:Major facilitator superfamily (MFS) profile domain-containing protein n=1 Tax=Psilocybe cyanescens TaxID=93625 RepID=A0A409WYW7_PSICY|nr:hypothetical protein CVT25_006128 [Psilocybe cyanescens]